MYLHQANPILVSIVVQTIEADTVLLERDPTKRKRTAIDQLVYKLYGLTEEEIKIVEDSTRRVEGR